MIQVNDLLDSTIAPLTIEKSDGTKLQLFQKDLSAGSVLDFVETEEGPERNAMLLRLVAQGICQEDGSPVFQTEEDMQRLREMPIRIFEQLSTAVVDAAGISASEDDEEGEEKNS